jgi:hypothetical protein
VTAPRPEHPALVVLEPRIGDSVVAGTRLAHVRPSTTGDARLVGINGAEGAIEVAPDDNAYLEPQGPPSVILLDLKRRSDRRNHSRHLVFEDAGEVDHGGSGGRGPPRQGGFEAPEYATGDN